MDFKIDPKSQIVAVFLTKQRRYLGSKSKNRKKILNGTEKSGAAPTNYYTFPICYKYWKEISIV